MVTLNKNGNENLLGKLKERFLTYFNKNLGSSQRHTAFTLAEVLITLGIIGIVAAMTIPTLINNAQKIQYVTKLKKFYTTQTNGWKELLASEGVENLEDTTAFSSIPKNNECSVSAGNVSDCNTFWTELQKHFKFKFIEAPNNYKVSYLNGQNASGDNSNNKILVLADGTLIISGDFYQKASSGYPASETSANTHFLTNSGVVITDINGFKKPNTWGRDVFMFEISGSGNLYPFYGNDFSLFESGGNAATWEKQNACGSNTDNLNIATSNGNGCAARIMEEGWEMNY